MSEQQPYRLKIQLTVIDELGVNLYSNTPAVLSELVANSWDADAENVVITLDTQECSLSIEDDGCGMDADALQNKFLNIGYRKRASTGAGAGIADLSEKFKRPYMGRKGIGKLSIFSIANKARVLSVVKDEHGSELFRGGILLNFEEIRAAAENEEDYHPEAITADTISGLEAGGTRIELFELKSARTNFLPYLRTRLARRFSVIGNDGSNPLGAFNVKIGDVQVTIEDRDYFKKLREVFWFGNTAKELYEAACTKLHNDPNSSLIPQATCSYEDDEIRSEYKSGGKTVVGRATGWLGFVEQRGDIVDGEKNSLNKIPLLVRGKLAHEDILPFIDESRVYRQYLIGEISADFLDDTLEDDIATASRQGMKEGDERFQSLIKSIKVQVKSAITKVSDLRKKREEESLLDLPAVKDWMGTLEGDSKHWAKKILKRVVGEGDVDISQQKTLIKHTILAFEYLEHRRKLETIEEMEDNDFERFLVAFSDLNRLEATMFGEIAMGRIEVIRQLAELLGDNALEKHYQSLLAKNLWLLDTSWDRATPKGNPIVEQSIRTAWSKNVDAADVEAGRIDIAYRTTGDLDVIIELKRGDRVVSHTEIIDQCDKYLSAYSTAKMMSVDAHSREKVEIPQPRTFVILGKLPKNWDNKPTRAIHEKMLKEMNVQVRFYQELLTHARESYEEYLEAEERTNTLRQILKGLDD